MTVTFRGDKLIVEGQYTPASAGSLYAKNADPGDEPEPASYEVLSIENEHGEDITQEFDFLYSPLAPGLDVLDELAEVCIATKVDSSQD